MKIVIIGANGQVGKELAVILNHWDHHVTAVVRNPFAAAFFDLKGIDYVISDVTSDDRARRAIQESDITVIAAVARGDFADAVRLNQSIIGSVCSKVGVEGKVIFFSSIRVLSREIDNGLKWYDPLLSYDREKRVSEKFFQSQVQKFGLKGHVFRLGHVIGPHQAKTKKFRQAIRDARSFGVPASRASNTVHTLTIADAICEAASGGTIPDCCTLVNNPQWSWEEVFRYVEPEAQIVFSSADSSKKEPLFRKALAKLLSLLQPVKKWLKQYKHHMNPGLAYTVYCQGRGVEIRKNLGELNGQELDLTEFEYSAAPGPYILGSCSEKRNPEYCRSAFFNVH